MGPSGKVVVVRFGDPNMGINRDDPEARKAFRLDTIVMKRKIKLQQDIGLVFNGVLVQK